MKRQLSDTVYRGLVRNAHTNIEMAQDDTQGRLQHPARQLNSYHPLFGEVALPDPPSPTLPTRHQDLLDTERRR
jgi:hypothetical protein